jgi:hypothetical protein
MGTEKEIGLGRTLERVREHLKKVPDVARFTDKFQEIRDKFQEWIHTRLSLDTKVKKIIGIIIAATLLIFVVILAIWYNGWKEERRRQESARNVARKRARLKREGYKDFDLSPTKAQKPSGKPRAQYEKVRCAHCKGRGWICRWCGGDGLVGSPDIVGLVVGNNEKCPACNGTGGPQERCYECGGTGRMKCKLCNGTGKDGQRVCWNCGGRGDEKCIWCDGDGSGKKRCPFCKGTGNIKKRKW